MPLRRGPFSRPPLACRFSVELIPCSRTAISVVHERDLRTRLWVKTSFSTLTRFSTPRHVAERMYGRRVVRSCPVLAPSIWPVQAETDASEHCIRDLSTADLHTEQHITKHSTAWTKPACSAASCKALFWLCPKISGKSELWRAAAREETEKSKRVRDLSHGTRGQAR